MKNWKLLTIGIQLLRRTVTLRLTRGGRRITNSIWGRTAKTLRGLGKSTSTFQTIRAAWTILVRPKSIKRRAWWSHASPHKSRTTYSSVRCPAHNFNSQRTRSTKSSLTIQRRFQTTTFWTFLQTRSWRHQTAFSNSISPCNSASHLINEASRKAQNQTSIWSGIEYRNRKITTVHIRSWFSRKK